MKRRRRDGPAARQLLQPGTHEVGQEEHDIREHHQNGDDGDVDRHEGQRLEGYFFKGNIGDAGAMNMFSPKGGVENPMPQQQMRMMPKWIGSTVCCHDGSRTGVTSMMMARVSINMPRNSKRITTKNHTRFTLLVKDRIQLAISTGIRYEVSR